MPFRTFGPEVWKRQVSRTLIFGPPDSWKTTSLLSWLPKGEVHVLSFPGEKGYATLPLGIANLHPYIWEGNVLENRSPSAVLAEVERLTLDILSGKNGKVDVAQFDGFHKYYDLILDDVTGGAYNRGEEFEPQLYGRAHRRAKDFLDVVLQSPVPYVVFTAWNAKELDRPLQPGEKARSVGSHEWPDLPGKMAKLILGEFSLVLFSNVQKPRTPTEKPKGEWILVPDNEVWGVHVKIDPRIAVRLPKRVPQNWVELERLLLAAYEQGTLTEQKEN